MLVPSEAVDRRIYLCGRVTIERKGRARNRAEALRVYAECRRLFRDELGAEPSGKTAAVFRSILRNATDGE